MRRTGFDGTRLPVTSRRGVGVAAASATGPKASCAGGGALMRRCARTDRKHRVSRRRPPWSCSARSSGNMIDERWGDEGGGGLLAAVTLDGVPENLAGRCADRRRISGRRRARGVHFPLQPARARNGLAEQPDTGALDRRGRLLAAAAVVGNLLFLDASEEMLARSPFAAVRSLRRSQPRYFRKRARPSYGGRGDRARLPRRAGADRRHLRSLTGCISEGTGVHRCAGEDRRSRSVR